MVQRIYFSASTISQIHEVIWFMSLVGSAMEQLCRARVTSPTIGKMDEDWGYTHFHGMGVLNSELGAGLVSGYTSLPCYPLSSSSLCI